MLFKDSEIKLEIPKITEIDKDIFSTIQSLLPKNLLEKALPRHLTYCRGKKILMSQLLKYTVSREDKSEVESNNNNSPKDLDERFCVIAYVRPQKNQPFVPRMFYFSQSRAIWRVAPEVKATGQINKGKYKFSCDLPVELMLALTNCFSEQFSKEDLLPITPKEISYVLSGYGYKEYISEFNNDPIKILEINPSDTYDELPLPRVDNQKVIENADEGVLPNPSKCCEIPSDNSFYNAIYSPLDRTYKMYVCPSRNGQYWYLYAGISDTRKNKQEKFVASLLTITPVNAELTSFCVAKDILDIGYEPTLPVVHRNDVLGYVSICRKDQLYNPLFLGSRRDLLAPTGMSDYCRIEKLTQDLPLNQVFLEGIQQPIQEIYDHVFSSLADILNNCLKRNAKVKETTAPNALFDKEFILKNASRCLADIYHGVKGGINRVSLPDVYQTFVYEVIKILERAILQYRNVDNLYGTAKNNVNFEKSLKLLLEYVKGKQNALEPLEVEEVLLDTYSQFPVNK